MTLTFAIRTDKDTRVLKYVTDTRDRLRSSDFKVRMFIADLSIKIYKQPKNYLLVFNVFFGLPPLQYLSLIFFALAILIWKGQK